MSYLLAHVINVSLPVKILLLYLNMEEANPVCSLNRGFVVCTSPMYWTYYTKSVYIMDHTPDTYSCCLSDRS